MLFLSSLSSCKSEVDKNQRASDMASQRFESLDRTQVDVYPQFEDCDEMETNADCFYLKLHELITKRLSQDTLTIAIERKDSLVAQFTVSQNGSITYDSISRCAKDLDKKFLDSVMTTKLENLPQIDSALKQGIPVASSYLIPIVIQPIGTADQ